MGGDGHGHGHHEKQPFRHHFTLPFNGMKTPKFPTFHYRIAQGVGAFMWFWVFYRLKNDGAHLLV